MSNALAIGAVTTALLNLLDMGINADPALSGTTITARPLDRAHENATGNQVNLFLYHTMPNAAWRNMDTPWQTKPGETGQPPLALTLHYLVTAYYGDSDDNVDTTTNVTRLLGSHRLLGRAMSILHDRPLLDTNTINEALPSADRLEFPYQQVERVRITPQPLSLDEMSKLWTGFQTQFRLSAAYEVSVVLIESTRPAKTPLPVLTIGPNNVGVTVQATLLPPYPTLEMVTPPNSQPSAHLDDTVTLTGHHLTGTGLVRFMNFQLEEAIDVAPLAAPTDSLITVQIPNTPADWPAGFYALAAIISPGTDDERTSNAFPLALAPRIDGIAPNPAARDGDGNVTLTITCSPEVRPGQRVSFLLGSREIVSQPLAAQTDTLAFTITDAPPGDHFVRLRVDGVDSLLVDRSVTPPVFDTSQQVTIT